MASSRSTKHLKEAKYGTKMKKALKLVACLLIALTVALAMNVSNASAQQALCDKSMMPTCSTFLRRGDCQEVPLPGYGLAQIQISFPPNQPVPPIYPPPAMVYELDLCDTQVSGQVDLTGTSTYDFKPPYPCAGEICNATGDVRRPPMPFTVVWKNTP
ncbi:MAG: hypothetical protein F6K55_43765 [Moorea sp. SIO4A3]|nr:hypothetical protein [Moorena sp. SIO4A3]